MLPLLNWPYAPNCYSIFIKIYDLLQLQFKTHSVLLRLAAEGRTSRFFWQLPKAATGGASASNRATTPWIAPTKHYIYLQPRQLAATAEDCAAGELISHSCTADRQPREPVGATRNNPLWGSRITGPEQNCCDGCKIELHPLSHQFTPDRCLFRPCLSFYKLS
jgi:hypothetical protein